MVKNKKNSNKSEQTTLVSFKVSYDLYEKLSAYADTQTDESGLKLSPSLAARRLMLEGLKHIRPKK
jgi:hypothetical protein